MASNVYIEKIITIRNVVVTRIVQVEKTTII